jgi:protein-L-isoaspartate(D-aspartate) O-methyltransferase
MNFPQARLQMVDQQVRTWEVLDPRVLDAMNAVARERFAPAEFQAIAYADAPIPLPGGQSMLAPKIDGRILQALGLTLGDTVLEVGTGSGYLAACLATLGARVTSLELRPELVALARANLHRTGTTGVEVVEADATCYTPDRRYDAVVLTASLPSYDPHYETWLKPGGRLFVVVGESEPMTAELHTLTRDGAKTRRELFETWMAPLDHARIPSHFSF